MDTQKFYYHFNLNGNEIKEASFEHVNTLPTTKLFSGRMVFDTVAKQVKIYDGTAWDAMGGNYIVTSDVTAIHVDNTTDPHNGKITIDLANTTDAGFMSSNDFEKLSQATPANNGATIVMRDANGEFTASSITITGTPTDSTDVATKGYVDGVLTSGMKIVSGIDASVNPDYPVANVGDAYPITVDGHMGGANGPLVKVGDMVLCTTENTTAGDHAAVGSNFIILERNQDLATTDIPGLVKFATAAEITAGTSTTAVPSVADVTSMIDSNSGAGTYATTIASGNTSKTVTHNLDGPVIGQFYDLVTKSYVECGLEYVDDNSCVVSVNPAADNDIKILLTGVTKVTS